jgi:hypothetical protein
MEEKLLSDAAQCAIKFVDEFDGSGAKNKCYQMMKAIGELTLKDIEVGDSSYQYTVNNILDKMESSERHPQESDTKNVSRYFDALSENLLGFQNEVKQIALENNLEAIPSFKKITGGGRANHTTYHIVATKLSDIEPLSEPIKDLANSEIRYSLETIENLPKWLRWMNNFELSGIRVKVLASLAIMTMMCSLLLLLFFMVIFQSPESTGLTITRVFISISIIIFFISSPFRLLYLCINNRIINAPDILVPHTIGNAQLECFATDKIRKSTGRPIRKIRMVSFVSTCPLCEARIEVEKAGKEFHRRLIGRCIESPIEHIYSFDRVLRIGKPLRH